MLLAHEKGAELIVAVGHALQPDRVPGAEPRRHVVDVPDAAAGGEILVDAKGVSRLVRRRVGMWPFVAFALTGLGAIVVAVVVSPGIHHLIELIVLRVRDWLGLG